MSHGRDIGLLCGGEWLGGRGAMEGAEELEVTVAQNPNDNQEEDDEAPEDNLNPPISKHGPSSRR